MINMTQKKPRRGRPAGGPLIGVRLPRELIEAIDEWDEMEMQEPEESNHTNMETQRRRKK